MNDKALFLDRDGVINVDYGHVHKREDFHFTSEIFDLARRAYEQSYKIVIVTNQAGIGRGFYSEEEFHQLTDWMCAQFSNAGAPIDKVYYSPYHPTAGIGQYLKDDFSRKPHPGMILQAKVDLDIDLRRSVLIGDKASDILAGNEAGVGTKLLLSLERPTELEGIAYESIATLHAALPYLGGDFALRGMQ